MPIRRELKRRRVDDGAATIAGSSITVASPLVSLQRDVSPPAAGLREVLRVDVLEGRGLDDTEDEDSGEEGDREGIEDESEKAEESGHQIMDDDTTEDESEEEMSKAGPVKKKSKPGLAQEAATASSQDKQQRPPAQRAPTRYIPSPIQLTRIRDLPPSHNIDTVSLHDILGHPLIKECWQFNYLLSIPFILQHFDPDIRSQVSLKIVHGFWRNDDARKQTLQEQVDAADGAKVQLIAAHMPEMFGTHHSKMMVIFRRDEIAQVVIHTANMIEQDWGNLTQAVWRSPLLPLLPEREMQSQHHEASYAIGTGLRFKADLLKYLRAYSSRARVLVDELGKYDFSGVRAALIASTPSRTPIDTSPTQSTTPWGWPGLKHMLSQIPTSLKPPESASIINIQISSVATLTEKWIQNFLAVLDSKAKPVKVAFGVKKKPKYNIIFPTAAEIRGSLDGYASGDSIHMRLQSAAQQKQQRLLKPMLCHWDGTIHEQATTTQPELKREALRNRAAPHIKTYIRFRDSSCKQIDWAMVTSANLSQQAWGFSEDKGGIVRISSYEIGVVVWPELFRESEDECVVMVPTSGKDIPDAEDVVGSESHIVVGLRIPYDLPLVPYRKDDVPWCATMSYQEPDWTGQVWGGYEDRM
jgi:tyrosyl-DNA phosphodiesterase-1